VKGEGPGRLILATAILLSATGTGQSGPTLPAPAPITLGLLLTEGGDADLETSRAAALAVRRANESGGVHGRPVRLVRSEPGTPWIGTASALVDLIYDKGASAVVGAMNGRAAHLAEQVIARARGDSIFVSAWATETTLTQNRIPWFFSVVPDDERQSSALAGAIFSGSGIRAAAVWSADGFDHRSAVAALIKASPPDAVKVFSSTESRSRARLASAIDGEEVGAVVLLADPGSSADLANWLHETGRSIPLFGPLSLAVGGFLEAAGEAAEGMVLIVPDPLGSEAAAGFRRDFELAYGAAPGVPAMYTYDAFAVLLAALRDARQGLELGEVLSGIRMDGATGEIRFDDNRGRDETPALGVIRSGTALPYHARRAAGLQR
jgi:ABC-type branched-subunit amino acid transport system substrate-binding protein